jgi:acyl-homoserine lactone acylase PvdQ
MSYPCPFLRVAFLLAVVLFSAASAPAAAEPDAGKVVVYRDDWGVPHLYADTAPQGFFAMGWAQAEDRLEELLKNYLRAMGEMSAAFGPENLQDDLQSRVFDHYGLAQKHYGRIAPDVRANIEMFARGINAYLASHSREVPAWWGARQVDPFMAVAFGRWFMWGWPLGQALSDLRAAGVKPDLTADFRSSNEWVVGPARSAVKAPILLIDPHLSWWGAQRFWEFRVHAGAWHGSGFTLPGCPYIGLGHNDHVAWAMTTGGPDTADVYELALNPAQPRQYRYDGAWRELTQRVVEIRVKGEAAPRRLTTHASHHGPIAARQGDKAWAAKLAYADEVQFVEIFHHFNLARNLAEFRRGLDLNQIMPQNVMAADTGGNIYYERAGRVPVRPAGYDFFKPVDGSTSATEWQGVHPASDHHFVLNPPQGYMQNCNIAPDVMMIGSPMTPDRKAAYLFGERGGSTTLRGARAVQLLAADDSVTIDEAQAYALDTGCYGFERWLAALVAADRTAGAGQKNNADYQTLLRSLAAWNGHADADSVGALHYWFWRQAMLKVSAPGTQGIARKIDDFMTALGRGRGAARELAPEEQQLMVSALAAAADFMRQRHGRLDLKFGDIFRVGRGDQSWPAGGGSQNEVGMGTLRAIGFEAERKDFTRWGRSGQTSTQIVVLGKPVRSWTQPPTGQSDRSDSPHYRDQAEKLFSPARFKPTWYAKAELLQHVKSRVELPGP